MVDNSCLGRNTIVRAKQVHSKYWDL
jgi:hypothetical protein